MACRTYTEKLERVISTGVDLRHMMRIKSENKDSIIRQQAGTIKRLENELEQARVSRNESAKLKGRMDKLQARHDDQELYLQRLKNYIKERNNGEMPVELTGK